MLGFSLLQAVPGLVLTTPTLPDALRRLDAAPSTATQIVDAALGVSPSASTDEITAAYRAIALRCHPDRRRGAADAAEQPADRLLH